MQLFHSPWWLIPSQAIAVAGVGWIQWGLMGTVTFTLPLIGLIAVLYLHQRFLYKNDVLPKMPSGMKTYWGIALAWSLVLVFLYVLTQSKEEVARIAKVLPILWLGIGLMDWVLMVCTQQLIDQQRED